MNDLVKMKKYFGKSFRFRKYNNLLDVMEINQGVKKFSGLTVFKLTADPEKGVVSQFSPSGLVFFIISVTIYYFSTYRTFSGDQTILRGLYNTRLKQYGDVYERIMASLLVTYVYWKIPFHSNLTTAYVKNLMAIDNSIEGLGVKIDHSIAARHLLISSVGQITVGLVRLCSVWITLSNLKMVMPVEVLIQTAATNILALVMTSHYCFYVAYLRSRYQMINKVLREIKDGKSWEQRMLVRNKQAVTLQKLHCQDKYVCEKIKMCAKSYGLIFEAVEVCEDMYGFSLVCTMLFCLLCIVLYLFYFMEATVAGLFHDTQRYVYFLIYVFWQILYAAGVIILNIYFSDSAVKEAGRTSYVVHEIANSDISPPVTAEAMQFSLQLVHQIPVFTAFGLCKIDYTLLLQGAYNVTTFLVILLQFVMD